MDKKVELEEQQKLAEQQISEKKQDIKFDTRDYVINYLVQQFEAGEFYVPLEYQRQFVWSDKEKCLYIESLLMGLPIPFMFYADTKDGRIEIVDGAQRTQTLVQFVQNDLELNNLTVLTNCNGFKFNELSPAVQRKFLNINIRVVFLEEGTTQKTRQEIFKRINTAGVPALPSETRRGSYEGPFKNFLEECVRNPLFNRLAPRLSSTEARYEGFELVSRFFAYYDNYNKNFPNYNGKVAQYIDMYVNEQNIHFIDNPSLLEDYRETFSQMLTGAEKLLGEQGFRKSLSAKSTPRARFEALSIGIALALQENPTILTAYEDKQVSWLEDEDFKKITKSDAANNKTKLRARIKYVKDKVLAGE